MHSRLSPGWPRQSGVTLVELMVTIAISLVLVLAATLLFLNTRSTQRAVNDRSAVYETGQLAMGLLARDITMAGFYPAVATEPSQGAGPSVSNVRATHDAAALNMGLAPTSPYASGVFGCAGSGFDGPASACKSDADVLPQSDAIVLSYFTEDAFSLATGQRADCTRSDVINDATIARNNQRAGANRPDLGPLPDAPLLVINAYHLERDTLTLDDGRTVASSSLTCWGNGGRQRTRLVQGVEQFVVRYGLMGDDTRRPLRYVDARGVVGQSAAINGEVLSGWQLVSTVRVCLLVRSPQITVQRDALPMLDCFNKELLRADGAQVRRFDQVFSVKNRQGNTVSLSTAVSGGNAAAGGKP
jgi:type IV pilus assembly protein PilW